MGLGTWILKSMDSGPGAGGDAEVMLPIDTSQQAMLFLGVGYLRAHRNISIVYVCSRTG